MGIPIRLYIKLCLLTLVAMSTTFVFLFMRRSEDVTFRKVPFDDQDRILLDPRLIFIEERVQERVRRLRYYCKRHASLRPKINSSANMVRGLFRNHFYASRKDSIAVTYCYIPKVGCTTLKSFFYNYNDFPKNKSLPARNVMLHIVTNKYLNMANFLGVSIKLSDIQRSLKVIFVRHPFERLVSAFENKSNFSVPESAFYYNHYWERLITHLRGPGSFIYNKTKPSFDEFLYLILSRKPRRYDPHWRRFTDTCALCTIDYDFVGHLETFEEDMELLFHKLGYKKPLSKMYTSGNTDQRTRMYFSTLRKNVTEELYKTYYWDFLLFDYSPDDYLIM